MTLSIFQQYETRKSKYKPGTVWVAKDDYNVIELEIVNPYDYHSENFVDYHEGWESKSRYDNSSYVYFKVLKGQMNREYSTVGALVRWTRNYNERHYLLK